MKEKFLNVKYVVAWAGCQTPLSERTFTVWEEAVRLYNANQDKLSVRVEEYLTKVRVKVVLPENKLNV